MLQYAARYHYNMAETKSRLVWLFAVINLFLTQLVARFYKPILFAGFLVTCAVVCLQESVKNHISLAATTRKYIDYSLFNFELPTPLASGHTKDSLIEQAVIIKRKTPKKAEQQYSSSGWEEDGGVKDWYVDVDPSLEQNEAVFYCQQQNRWWDKRLSDFYLKLLKGLLLFFVFVFVVTFRSRSLLDICYLLLSISPLSLKVFAEYKAVRDYREISGSVDALIECLQETGMPFEQNYLLRLQNKIDVRRELPFIIPDFVHRTMSKTYHQDVKEKNALL